MMLVLILRVCDYLLDDSSDGLGVRNVLGVGLLVDFDNTNGVGACVADSRRAKSDNGAAPKLANGVIGSGSG